MNFWSETWEILNKVGWVRISDMKCVTARLTCYMNTFGPQKTQIWTSFTLKTTHTQMLWDAVSPGLITGQSPEEQQHFSSCVWRQRKRAAVLGCLQPPCAPSANTMPSPFVKEEGMVFACTRVRKRPHKCAHTSMYAHTHAIVHAYSTCKYVYGSLSFGWAHRNAAINKCQDGCYIAYNLQTINLGQSLL